MIDRGVAVLSRYIHDELTAKCGVKSLDEVCHSGAPTFQGIVLSLHLPSLSAS